MQRKLEATVASIALIAAMAPLSVGAETHEAPSDDLIEIEVSSALQRDEFVPVEDLDIDVEDGIVTLDGVVDTPLAEQRALNVTGTVRGVRGYVDSIDVVPEITYSDEVIESDVTRALVTNGATDAFEIAVSADNGVVSLAGEVDSWVERDVAARVAMDVDGVVGVQNNIVLAYDEDRRDAEIEADVNSALRWAADVDELFIDVSVEDGIVNLSGSVESVPERLSAYTEAWVAGVRDVNVDELLVTPFGMADETVTVDYGPMEDLEIESAIERRLLVSPRVSGLSVEADVEDGVVTLTGTVDHLAASWEAADIAAGTTGVISVVNNLDVTRDDTVTDSEIESTVQETLNSSVFFDDDQIRAQVTNKVIELTGEVETVTAKVHAENLAASAAGVAGVNNNIAITQETGDLVIAPFTQSWDFTYYPWYTVTFYDVDTSDAEIAEEIRDELWWSPFVDSDDVTVIVEDGVATLTGSVDTLSEWRAAEENAFEGGALAVNNNIEIELDS